MTPKLSHQVPSSPSCISSSSSRLPQPDPPNIHPNTPPVSSEKYTTPPGWYDMPPGSSPGIASAPVDRTVTFDGDRPELNHKSGSVGLRLEYEKKGERTGKAEDELETWAEHLRNEQAVRKSRDQRESKGKGELMETWVEHLLHERPIGEGRRGRK